MKIIIRLVGYSEIINDEKYAYEYTCNVNRIFNFTILKLIFNKYENIISSEELDNCTLTCNSKNLKKDSLLDNDIIYRVFIFSGNSNIKNKLVTIFKLKGQRVSINNIFTDDKKDTSSKSINNIELKDPFNNVELKDPFNNVEINKEINEEINEEFRDKILEILKRLDPDDEEVEKIEDIDQSEIKQNLDLFKDTDFITLIRIYKNRGELFNDFYKYINSYQIIKFNKLENDIDLTENINFIKDLGLNFQEEHIIDALKNTGNHLNLAIRYLLQNT